MRILLALVAVAACSTPSAGDGPDAAVVADSGSCVPESGISIAALTGHNTSANPHYDRAHFPANFGTETWVTQAGATMPVHPDATDLSLNPVTPAHVSNVDVHTLVPSRPDLRWFAHVVPWFKPGGGNHIDIGIDNNSMTQVAAMVDDMRRRGFDGLVINWYGKDSYTDQVSRLVQQYIQDIPGFTMILMLDKGIPNLSTSVLSTQLAYIRTQYMGDSHYEHEGTKPIVMFFGVTAVLGDAGMAQVKAANSDMVWVPQGANALAQSWVDESFDWTHDWHDGASATDPYNLAGLRGFYSGVKSSPKKAFGAMTSSFNGMLTKTVAWSKGKYLPSGGGECLVEWARVTDQVIPPNVTRVQWVTWNDWEEGSIIEPGIENFVSVTAARDGSALTWTVDGNEQTIDHYAIYATYDGDRAVLLGTVPAGTHDFALTACGDYQAFVIAVGKPAIRDHASNRVP